LPHLNWKVRLIQHLRSNVATTKHELQLEQRSKPFSIYESLHQYLCVQRSQLDRENDAKSSPLEFSQFPHWTVCATISPEPALVEATSQRGERMADFFSLISTLRKQYCFIVLELWYIHQIRLTWLPSKAGSRMVF